MLGCVALLLIGPLGCLTTWLVLRAVRDGRAEDFRAACAASSSLPYPAARSLLENQLPGQVVVVEEWPHDPDGHLGFQVHTGIGSFARCSIELQADHVTRV